MFDKNGNRGGIFLQPNSGQGSNVICNVYFHVVFLSFDEVLKGVIYYEMLLFLYLLRFI